jgi:hypothetical protein
MADLISRPLIEITRALREKRLTAQELVEVAIANTNASATSACLFLRTPDRAVGPGARMDTAPLGKALQDLIGQGGTNLRLLVAPGVTPLEGGAPIVADGKIAGVWAAMSDQDAQCAWPAPLLRRPNKDGNIVAPACPTPPRHYGAAEFVVTKPVDFDSLERQLRQLSPP